MSAAATTSAPNPQPGPKAGAEPPPRIAKLLFLVRWLISYGQQIAATARQRVTAADYFLFAAPFGTADINLIVERIAYALRLAQALEQRLLRRAATGRDIGAGSSSGNGGGGQSGRKPRSAAAKAKAAERRAARRAELRGGYLPSAEEIARQILRRPFGAVIGDICRNCGILPGNIEAAIWRELDTIMMDHGGSPAEYICGMIKRCFDPATLGRSGVTAPAGLAEALTPPLSAYYPPPQAAAATGPP